MGRPLGHTYRMAEKRPMGWIIRVSGGAPGTKNGLFAVVANSLEHATVLVGDHLGVTSQSVEMEKILTDGEVTRLGLKLGEVKSYA